MLGVCFGVLWLAFVVAAVLFRQEVVSSGMGEIWGWDYQSFVERIGDWRWIGYMGFRHPGLGVVMSPLVALQHLWSGAYMVVMPAVATATAWMIWKLSGLSGLVAWLCFPVTWIMAGTPESFPLAQLALVGSCYGLLNEKRIAVRWGQRALPVFDWAFAILNAAVTLTNGVKPLLGWLALHGRELDRKMMLRGGLTVVGLVLLGSGIFYVRTVMTGRGMGAGVAATLSWIPAERNLPRELYGFFIRPVGLYQSFVVYPLAVLGCCKIVRSHRASLLVLLSSYFAVDIFIHFIVGWGMSEPWVFAPHWIWMLPIVFGRGFGFNRCCSTLIGN